MKVKAFVSSSGDENTTGDQLVRTHQRVGATSFLGSYAYATESGTASFELRFGQSFWDEVESKWLFGIDYGRTQPKALRFIASKPNAEVRIFDGSWIVGRPDFIPRRDFHMKAAFLVNADTDRFGMVSGSGNFSASGLASNVECGVMLFAENKDQYERTFRAAHVSTEMLWAGATPLADVIEAYDATWTAKNVPVAAGEAGHADFKAAEAFWIEAGYVTRNRGPNRPGNQIDLPRGVSTLFGLHATPDQPRNSTIGEITYITPTGDEVIRNLRLGDNSMEKMTLPIPETHGLDLYDGKVLVFRKSGAKHLIWAFEQADFETAFRGHLGDVKAMASGRRYGYIAI